MSEEKGDFLKKCVSAGMDGELSENLNLLVTAILATGEVEKRSQIRTNTAVRRIRQ